MAINGLSCLGSLIKALKEPLKSPNGDFNRKLPILTKNDQK